MAIDKTFQILHVSGQIDILCGWLVDVYSIKGSRYLNLIVIRKIIQAHQRIITFSEHIEDLYSGIAIALLILNTLVICCLGFMIVAVSSFRQLRVAIHRDTEMSLKEKIRNERMAIIAFDYRPFHRSPIAISLSPYQYSSQLEQPVPRMLS